jgi:hypothetical protein
VAFLFRFAENSNIKSNPFFMQEQLIPHELSETSLIGVSLLEERFYGEMKFKTRAWSGRLFAQPDFQTRRQNLLLNLRFSAGVIESPILSTGDLDENEKDDADENGNDAAFTSAE